MLELDIVIRQIRNHVPMVRRKLARDQHLYRAGQAFHSLYVVDAGTLKTSELAADGREQVTGFRMRGDWIGLESIGLDRCRCDAVALDLSYVWELPFEKTMAACMKVRDLQVRLHEAFAREIRSDWMWMLAMGTLGADNRVAAFLLDLAQRHSRLGFGATRLLVPMRRIDIANYLALKHETVSRALSRLERAGLIGMRGRDVSILDLRGLAGVAHANQLEPAPGRQIDAGHRLPSRPAARHRTPGGRLDTIAAASRPR